MNIKNAGVARKRVCLLLKRNPQERFTRTALIMPMHLQDWMPLGIPFENPSPLPYPQQGLKADSSQLLRMGLFRKL